MSFMLGFIGKADALTDTTVVDAHGFRTGRLMIR